MSVPIMIWLRNAIWLVMAISLYTVIEGHASSYEGAKAKEEVRSAE